MILPHFWRSKSEISITLDPNMFQEGHVSFGDYRYEPVPCPFQLVVSPGIPCFVAVLVQSLPLWRVSHFPLFSAYQLLLCLFLRKTVMAFKSRRDNLRQTLHLKIHSNHKSKDPFFLVK